VDKRKLKMKICSNCKEEVTSCDSGHGHKFKIGDKIYCNRKPKPYGSLHFCDIGEMEQAILDLVIAVRSFGKEATVIKGIYNQNYLETLTPRKRGLKWKI
jgi:hypothetical protein